jgi:tRNA modification GTPase
METIAAIATPPGRGAVALLRVSGEDALAVASRVFRPGNAGAAPVPFNAAELRPRLQNFGAIVDGESVVDEVLLTVFRAPASFTGEDVVEIGCHGGSLVTRRILELLLRSGAVAAGPGEFSRRAYLNGKLDLTQAEAIMDLIGAQSDLAMKAAARQLEGRLGERIRELHSRLLDLLAHLEAYIDFPEDDISPDTGEAMLARMRGAMEELNRLLATALQGRVLRVGARTVLSGAPNVGKSSLLNRLLGFERAIVSPVPGTTRDTLEETVMVRGWPLRLVDTAGLRDGADALEQEGIERARRQLEQADLVLGVFDGTLPAPESALLEEARLVRVLNKADLPEHPSWGNVQAVRISCVSGQGMDDLEAAVEARLRGGLGLADAESDVAINARHQDCLRRSLGFLEAAAKGLKEGLPPEFVAEELRAALDSSGEVVGKSNTEDLLGRIFSSFCIGK